MSYYEISWYLFFLLVVSAIFVCGYKIGHIRGWRHGYNDYGTILEQKYARKVAMAAAQWPQDAWDYTPKEKATARSVYEQPPNNAITEGK